VKGELYDIRGKNVNFVNNIREERSRMNPEERRGMRLRKRINPKFTLYLDLTMFCIFHGRRTFPFQSLLRAEEKIKTTGEMEVSRLVSEFLIDSFFEAQPVTV
jgi:hypothetical protein